MAKTLLITSDLACCSAVAGAARRLGIELQTALGIAAVESKLADPLPALAILDLTTAGLNVADFVGWLRGRLGQAVPILAFGPHVRTHELEAAEDAGCNVVVSRGEFHARQDELLRTLLAKSRDSRGDDKIAAE